MGARRKKKAKNEAWASGGFPEKKGGGTSPPGINDLNPVDGPPVWKGNPEPSACGIDVLGSPVGHKPSL